MAQLALTSYQLLGIGGIVLGLLLVVRFRAVADLLAAARRAEAGAVERATPRRAREVVSIWMRSGTGDDAHSKGVRYGLVLLVGTAALLTGLAALLGAWTPPAR